jgi:hypothetical protein
MESPAQRTFFVESFVPALDEARAAELSAELRSAIAELRHEGVPVDWLRSFALLGEETYVWVVAASAVDDIALVEQRSRLTYEHVVEVVADE